MDNAWMTDGQILEMRHKMTRLGSVTVPDLPIDRFQERCRKARFTLFGIHPKHDFLEGMRGKAFDAYELRLPGASFSDNTAMRTFRILGLCGHLAPLTAWVVEHRPRTDLFMPLMTRDVDPHGSHTFVAAGLLSDNKTRELWWFPDPECAKIYEEDDGAVAVIGFRERIR